MPTINGTSGGDNLVGTNGPDTLNGFEGDDALDGNGGVDQLFGGPGDDFLSIRSPPIAGGVFDGGEGTDTLYVSLLANAFGVPGASLTGVSLVSLERLLFGETLGFLAVAEQRIQVNWSQLTSFFPELVGRMLGRDTLDILLPNAGTYRVPDFLKTSWNSTDTISLTATGAGDYTLSASGSSVGIEALNGAGGNDRLTGNSLINLLSGGSGDDTLIGGAGADRLTGGLGNDTFIDTRAGLDGDAITDFTVADRIVLTDANLATFTFSLNGNTLTYSGGALTFGSPLNGTLMATSAVGGGVQLAIEPSTINDARSDFNGDGRSDVLWENATTLLYSNWLGTASGGFLIHDADALDNWAIGGIVAVGDFNGDGRDDTLWRESSGAIYLSPTGVGGSFIFSDSAGFVANVPNDWQILGAGDFDGDGKDDILWRNDDGRISNWLSNGDYTFNINDANALTSLLVSSTILGIGDFNGDGRDDIVSSQTGFDVSSFELSFGQQSGAFGKNFPFTGPFGVPIEWQIAGIGDFNGDGRDDLLWRHENGTISNWLYVGGLGLGTFNINDAVAMRNVSIDWQVVAVGDYNGDGWDDILWRNSTTGHLSDWLGQQNGDWLINDIHALVAVPLDWVVGPHEFLSSAGLWDY